VSSRLLCGQLFFSYAPSIKQTSIVDHASP
jgi:hypothetical protein